MNRRPLSFASDYFTPHRILIQVPARALMRILSPAGALGFLLLSTTACPSSAPEASGHCEGLAGLHEIDHDAIVKDTYFYRLDYDDGLEEAQVEMAFGDDQSLAMTISMTLNDMPTDRHAVDHVLGDDGVSEDEFVRVLTVVDPFDAPPIKGGNFALTTSSNTELTGVLDMVFSDNTETSCAVTIPRDYDRDTDD